MFPKMNIRFFIIYNSPFLALVISISMFALVDIVQSADTKFEACARVNCGRGSNISYPFWIPNKQESYCGHPKFVISCRYSYPILSISGGDYVILNIFYNNNSILLSNTMLYYSDNTCPIPLHNFSISNTPFDYGLGCTDLFFLYNCSSYPSDPTYKVGCATNASRASFAVFHPEILEYNNYSTSSCQSCVNTPVQGDDINPLLELNYTSVLRNGFVLNWTDTNCIKCNRSGGRCGFRNEEFICFCPDRPHSQTCDDGNRSNVGRNMLIGICSTIGAVVIMVGTFGLCKVSKREINRRNKKKFFKRNGGLLLQQQNLSSDCNTERTKIFNSYELEKATDNYSVDRVLGQGGQGTVYRGRLSDGKNVAVKKSKITDKTKVKQFINEVVILSQIKHRNIVKLFGCCLETEVPLLVYEFISNGTLLQHIHHPNENFPLTWELRVRIGAEIAGALAYLHSAVSMPIYHRDIKSTNILLDDNYKAIISDFGTSRTVNVEKTHLTTLVQGTFGYLDPEYFLTSQFTEKSDVYSFGVVLVELLTGQKSIYSNASGEVIGLAGHFIQSMEENSFHEIIDPKINKEDRKEEMVAVAQLAKACLYSNGKRRPTMKEVAMQLEGIRMYHENGIAQGYDPGTIESSSMDLIEVYGTSLTTTETLYASSSDSSLDVDSPMYP